jgi:hypothetical protein
MAQSSGIVHRNEINSQVMYTFCAYSERADEMTVPHKETGWRVLWARARARLPMLGITNLPRFRFARSR